VLSNAGDQGDEQQATAKGELLQTSRLEEAPRDKQVEVNNALAKFVTRSTRVRLTDHCACAVSTECQANAVLLPIKSVQYWRLCVSNALRASG